MTKKVFTNENNLYELQYIYGSKIDKELEQITYFVKWNNFNKSESTWEPLTNIGFENIQSIRRFQRHSDYNIFYQEILGNYKEIFGTRVHYKNEIQEIIQMNINSQSESIVERNDQKKQKENYKKQAESEKRNEKYKQEIFKNKLKQQKTSIYFESSESYYKQKRRQPKNKRQKQNIKEKKQLQEQELHNQDNEDYENDGNKSQSKDQLIVSKPNLRKKQIEEIQSEDYYNKLKNILNNLDQNDVSKISSRINQNNKVNSYELLIQLIIFDYEQQVNECLNGLINQYDNEQYQKPNIIVKQEMKTLQKQIKSTIKKKHQGNLQIEDDKKKKKKGLLKKNTDDIPSIKDFLINMKVHPQIGLFSVQKDNLFNYGQIGFQKGESIQGHTYGFSTNDNKPEINLYFIMEFRRTENGEKPLFNFVTKAECMLYEKDLLLDYVALNEQSLPDLYNELIQ